MMSNEYTIEEDNFIKKNYLNMTDEEIGEILNRTGKSVNTHRTNILKLFKEKKKNPNKSKYSYDYIKEEIDKIDYILISEDYKNNREKLILSDKEGYFYSISYDSLQKGCEPKKFHISNPYTIQNIKLWCKLNNKPFKLLSNTYEGKGELLRWQCLKEDCKEPFLCSWHHIIRGKGCGVCHGKQVGLSNCLATKRPDLASEWHPTKNGDLTPYDVTANSNKEVWWLCKDNPKHEWSAVISSRNNGRNCPYCSGRKPSNDYNLLIINPEICKEWNYNKNDKKPEEYCPNSGIDVWWQCLECGHEWKTRIADRNSNGYGCPECSKSKGEKKCREIFLVNSLVEINQTDYKLLFDLNSNINYFIPQYEFEGLIGLGNRLLSYDFYLPQHNLLIEYQGRQHEVYIPGFHKSKKDFEKQLEHDRRKSEYAQKHNIRLLEIWYWDFDRIEEILSKYLGL